MKSLVGLVGVLSLAGFSWVGMGMHEQMSTELETQANSLLASSKIEGVEVEFDHFDAIVRGADTPAKRNDVRDILGELPPVSRIEFADESEEAETTSESVVASEPEPSTEVETGEVTTAVADDATKLFSEALVESEASFVPGDAAGTDLSFTDREINSTDIGHPNVFMEPRHTEYDDTDKTQTSDAEPSKQSSRDQHTYTQDATTVEQVTEPETPAAEPANQNNNLDNNAPATTTEQSSDINDRAEKTTREDIAGNDPATTTATATEEETNNADRVDDTASPYVTSDSATDDIDETVIAHAEDNTAETTETSGGPDSAESVVEDSVEWSATEPAEAIEKEMVESDSASTNENTPDADTEFVSDDQPPQVSELANTAAADMDESTQNELQDTPNEDESDTGSADTGDLPEQEPETETKRKNDVNSAKTDFPGPVAAINLTKDKMSAKIDEVRLGLYMTGLDDDNVVRRLDKNSSVDRAGLQIGDRITRIGSQKVNSFDDVKTSVKGKKVGDIIRIWFERKETLYLVDVRLLGQTPQATLPETTQASTDDN